MKNFINMILDEPTSEPIFKFVPQIKISPKSTLHLEIEPKDPHTASNIVVNAFQSKINRTIVPVRIQWSRYKFKSDEQFTVQKLPSVVGNTYMCEPSDLGSVIQAKVKCIDPMIGGQAQATIGPIRIEPTLKRLIDGALYNQSILSQVIIVEGEQKFNVNLRLGKNTMQFTEINTSQKLMMPYSFSQPKIQLSPKDPCKVYFRFELDTSNKVRNWLNKLAGPQKNLQTNMNESSMSIKVPHSNVSAFTSKNKLFQKSPVHCKNKLQVRFLGRNPRDLFLYTLRAFICKQDMKNAVIMQRIQTLLSLKTEQDYNKFLEYISLKSQIIRIAEIAKQLEQDRDSKVKDIADMEESISQMTLTYLKIIEEKSQKQHVDLEQSYSMISIKREEILGRKQFRELKAQNERLKTHIRQLNEQIQLQKFFKKDDNQSMIFNQTANPFMKKHNISGIVDQNQSASYYLNVPQTNKNEPSHKNMLQISKSYLRVLEQNKKLKSGKGSGKLANNQSADIEHLLESLHENQDSQKKLAEMHVAVQTLKNQITKLSQVNKQLAAENSKLKLKGNSQLNGSYQNSPNKIEYSYYSRSIQQNNSMISNSYISMNQSMTSEAELILLQKKLIELSNINAKFESENTRLRKERDYFRSLYETETAKNKETKNEPNPKKQDINETDLLNGGDIQNSLIIRLQQEKQKLQNQKFSLLKKVESLTRESNQSANKPDLALQRKCQEFSKKNQQLLQDNESLRKTINNMKSFYQLQKKQLQNNGPAKSSSNVAASMKDLVNAKDQEIQKLKKTNARLMNDIKELKIQIEKKNDHNLANSRVFQLQNQLNIYKAYAKNGMISNQLDPSVSTEEMINELTSLRKQNQRLKEQISTLETKIKNQTVTIQKLMAQLDELHQHSRIFNASNAETSFNKKYLTPPGTPGRQPSELERYRKKVTELQSEVEILRRNSEAFNRSRDLSMSMMGFEEQRLEIYKKENESLMLEIENLSKMCSKYSRDAKQANMQVNKLRQKIAALNKQKFSNLQ